VHAGQYAPATCDLRPLAVRSQVAARRSQVVDTPGPRRELRPMPEPPAP
jgi:hypothetical protein